MFWTQQKSRFITRQYTVFNVQQADGLSLPSLFGQPPPEWATHTEAERIIRGSGVLVQHVPGDRAYYQIDKDQVVLPEPSHFLRRNGYYQTALHECGHSTGHPDRMDRDTLKKGIGGRVWIAWVCPRRIAGRDQRHDDGGARGRGARPAAWSRLRRELGEGARRRPARDSPRCC